MGLTLAIYAACGGVSQGCFGPSDPGTSVDAESSHYGDVPVTVLVRAAGTLFSTGDFTISAAPVGQEREGEGSGPPANDNCASASRLELSGPTLQGTTIGATQDGPTGCGSDANLDVWYTIVIPRNSEFGVFATSATMGLTMELFVACAAESALCLDGGFPGSTQGGNFQYPGTEPTPILVRIASDGNTTGDFEISATLAGEGEGEGKGEGEGEGEDGRQSADLDANFNVSLSEPPRVTQFYNSGGLHREAGTEDSFAPGPGTDLSRAPYDTDYNPLDRVISLSELLRIIQSYNSLGYRDCPLDSTEDGFCAGL